MPYTYINSTGNCRICVGKCHWSVHHNVGYRIVHDEITVEKVCSSLIRPLKCREGMQTFIMCYHGIPLPICIGPLGNNRPWTKKNSNGGHSTDCTARYWLYAETAHCADGTDCIIMKLPRRPGILGDARQIPRRHLGKNERGKTDEPNQNRVRNHPKNRPFHYR